MVHLSVCFASGIWNQLSWGREPAQFSICLKGEKKNNLVFKLRKTKICGKLESVSLAGPPDSALASVFTGLETSPLCPPPPSRVQTVAAVRSFPVGPDVPAALVSGNLVSLSRHRDSADVAQNKTINRPQTLLDSF